MPDNELWERQKGESEQAYQAFSLYRDLGLSRTVKSVANELNKSRTIINRWKMHWNWEERARAFDNDITRKAKANIEESLKMMYFCQIDISLQVQAKALEALDRLATESMSPRDIKEYLKLSTELERLNRIMTAELESKTINNYSAEGSASSDDVIIYVPDDGLSN